MIYYSHKVEVRRRRVAEEGRAEAVKQLVVTITVDDDALIEVYQLLEAINEVAAYTHTEETDASL